MTSFRECSDSLQIQPIVWRFQRRTWLCVDKCSCIMFESRLLVISELEVIFLLAWRLKSTLPTKLSPLSGTLGQLRDIQVYQSWGAWYWYNGIWILAEPYALFLQLIHFLWLSFVHSSVSFSWVHKQVFYALFFETYSWSCLAIYIV